MRIKNKRYGGIARRHLSYRMVLLSDAHRHYGGLRGAQRRGTQRLPYGDVLGHHYPSSVCVRYRIFSCKICFSASFPD